MKILFLQNVLFEYRIPFYNGLVKRGHEVTVLHSGAALSGELRFKQLFVPVVQYGPFYFQKHRPRLAEFDVVVAMFDLHWPANLWPALFGTTGKYIFWGHGLGRHGAGNRLRVALANRSDGLVLYTEVGREAMIAAGVSRENTYVANNTVEVSNHQAKTVAGDSFLYVGRLQGRKRIDLMMQAFALIYQQVKDKALKLSIVGEGDIRSELETLATTLGISEVTHFYGALTDNEVLKPLFHQALAYVSPGHLGLGLNHALAFGVPILSNSAVEHAPEVAVLSDNNSIMINAVSDEECIEQLSAQMLKLASDDEFANRLSKQSYADYVNHCSMDRMLDGFEAAFSGKGQ